MEKPRQLGLRSGIPGFAISYSVANISGTVYYLYARGGLILLVSAFVDEQKAIMDTKTINPEYTAFRAAVEAVVGSYVTL
jgi:hypothetical protein